MNNKIKEKVLKEVYKKGFIILPTEEADIFKIVRKSAKSFYDERGLDFDRFEWFLEETRDLTLAEVGKVIDDWKFELVGMLNMKAFHNKEIEVPFDIEDIEELKQKLGIKW